MKKYEKVNIDGDNDVYVLVIISVCTHFEILVHNIIVPVCY